MWQSLKKLDRQSPSDKNSFKHSQSLTKAPGNSSFRHDNEHFFGKKTFRCDLRIFMAFGGVFFFYCYNKTIKLIFIWYGYLHRHSITGVNLFVRHTWMLISLTRDIVKAPGKKTVVKKWWIGLTGWWIASSIARVRSQAVGVSVFVRTLGARRCLGLSRCDEWFFLYRKLLIAVPVVLVRGKGKWLIS